MSFANNIQLNSTCHRPAPAGDHEVQPSSVSDVASEDEVTAHRRQSHSSRASSHPERHPERGGTGAVAPAQPDDSLSPDDMEAIRDLILQPSNKILVRCETCLGLQRYAQAHWERSWNDLKRESEAALLPDLMESMLKHLDVDAALLRDFVKPGPHKHYHRGWVLNMSRMPRGSPNPYMLATQPYPDQARKRRASDLDTYHRYSSPHVTKCRRTDADVPHLSAECVEGSPVYVSTDEGDTDINDEFGAPVTPAGVEAVARLDEEHKGPVDRWARMCEQWGESAGIPAEWRRAVDCERRTDTLTLRLERLYTKTAEFATDPLRFLWAENGVLAQLCREKGKLNGETVKAALKGLETARKQHFDNRATKASTSPAPSRPQRSMSIREMLAGH